MISTCIMMIDSLYPLSLVKIDSLTLELMPLTLNRIYCAKAILNPNKVCVVFQRAHV